MFSNLFCIKSTRYFLFVLIAVAAMAGSACVRRVNVNELLPVNQPLATDQLIDRINAYGQIQTFSAQTDVTVWNYFTGEGAKADEFPQATGLNTHGLISPLA